ncbi:MAG: sulfotransferase [Bacteroidetes bacterium]|nr:MAG: sulfotransferase [Bacteroidota bacterium]
MPRTPKQYFRALLVKLGLFDEAAFRLVIDRVYPDDTFIVSFPKSGNTWMRFLLANMLRPEGKWNFRNIDSIVPDVYSARDAVNALARPRFVKAHHAWYNDYPKTIYIVRDYRDVLVSYYHYQVALKAWTGSFPGFIAKADTLHDFGSWKEHVEHALDFAEKNPERLLFLRYEDLLEKPEEIIREVAAFCGITLSIPAAEIITRCDFSALQDQEKKHGSAFMDKSEKQFFREGKSGNWRQYFNDEDHALIMRTYGNLLKKLGYV